MRVPLACALAVAIAVITVMVACNPLDLLRRAPDASGDGADAGTTIATATASTATSASRADSGHDNSVHYGVFGRHDGGSHRVAIDASIDPAACHPACTRNTVCAGGHCVCPFRDDVLCPKGCVNPKTDNFACGCTTGSAGAVCPASQECCDARCVACPAGQLVDPATCACKGAATPAAGAAQLDFSDPWFMHWEQVSYLDENVEFKGSASGTPPGFSFSGTQVRGDAHPDGGAAWGSCTVSGTIDGNATMNCSSYLGTVSGTGRMYTYGCNDKRKVFIQVTGSGKDAKGKPIVGEVVLCMANCGGIGRFCP